MLVRNFMKLQKDVEYTITKGNDQKKFDLVKKNGIWALHFRRRLKHPGTFDLIIHGRPIEAERAEDLDNEVYEKPLTLRVRLVVEE